MKKIERNGKTLFFNSDTTTKEICNYLEVNKNNRSIERFLSLNEDWTCKFSFDEDTKEIYINGDEDSVTLEIENVIIEI
jgi:hypothetical protein